MSEVSSPASARSPGRLEAGRDAIVRHAWAEALELLTAADGEEELAGPDLELLAVAAFFTGRAELGYEVKERAFAAHLGAGDPVRAGYLAIDLAQDAWHTGRRSIASAWIRRAESLLGEGETYAHGYLALIRSEAASGSGDVDAALRLAEQALEIAGRTDDRDLRAQALSTLGALKIATGAAPDGLALMEEASIAAVSGELSPFTSGVTACRMISACRDLTDYRRASEWIEATERYCRRQSVSGFPGVCRIHRAEVVAVQGGWDQAEHELEQATAELESYQATPPQADGFYALGEIRRQRGDLEAAEAALREAHARGRSPHPALALIRLARGDVKGAVAAIDAAVADETWNRWARARLLPAQAEILVAAGHVARARAAVDELGEIVAEYPSPALVAGRQAATGRVLLAEGDAGAAARELRAAVRGWRQVGAPYEVARSRALLARALRALDDDGDADLELRAAMDEFRRLGAQVDALAAERELREAADRRGSPHQVRRTFMFTDIVGSTRLAEALGNAAWERLLRWHDETLRRLVDAGGGTVVNSTGDGFFVAFDSPASAVACAVSIQRALRDHEEAVGFVPAVRIGLHEAEASERAGDYSGIGVHVAARVGAIAQGGEILATESVLREAGAVAAGAVREVDVRGSSAPVRVASVAWR